VGTSDPLEFIEAESQRIPFKAALSRPHEWQDTFKNRPLPPIAGWRNWYKRILDDDNAKTSNWDSLRIAQCLELSLAETPKNENLLIAYVIFGQMVSMLFSLVMDQCLLLWPMSI
jgi:hypothetical protein